MDDQVSSSQPVATLPMSEDAPIWTEPKRKPLLSAWDWRNIDSEGSGCTWCECSGIVPISDNYPADVDTSVKATSDDINYLSRPFLYVAKLHACQWALRGRETRAGFPTYLMRKAQDSFDWSLWKAKRPAYQAYLDAIDERTGAGDGLVFVGSVGTGKTHLAVLAGRVAVRQGWNVFFTTVTDLLSDLRQTYRDGSALSENHVMEHVKGVDLLILDDATVEKQTDWTQDALYRVVNARYESEKATILTANTTLDGMRERLGERLVSRIYERSIVLDFTGADYRITERKARQL